jgi:hypothetical protein
MSYYAPDPSLLPYGITCCLHCGCRPVLHHTDGRCYTTDEIGERLREYQRTARWPGPDEGGVPAEEDSP